MKRLAIVLLLGLALAGPAYAAHKVKPAIRHFAPTAEGATFQVRNPLPFAVQIKFECKSAFSKEWLELPARSTRTYVITAGDPIEEPCLLPWRRK